MPVRPIVEYPAAVLLSPGDQSKSSDSELESLVKDMFETMYDDGGVGWLHNRLVFRCVCL